MERFCTRSNVSKMGEATQADEDLMGKRMPRTMITKYCVIRKLISLTTYTMQGWERGLIAMKEPFTEKQFSKVKVMLEKFVSSGMD